MHLSWPDAISSVSVPSKVVYLVTMTHLEIKHGHVYDEQLEDILRIYLVGESCNPTQRVLVCMLDDEL